MGKHSVAEAKNRLSDLIDRALAGEGVTITRHGRLVVELRLIEAEPGTVRQEDLYWLAARAATRGGWVGCRPIGRWDARRRGALTLYLDTGVLVSLLAQDAST